MRFKFLAVLFLLLFSASALALAVNTPRPTMHVVFDEPVDPSSLNATLLNSNNTAIPLSPPAQINSTAFNFVPQADLVEGTYTFSINANDVHGNPGPQETVIFDLVFRTLNITLALPMYASSERPVFDIEVHTDRDARCFYSQYNTGIPEMIAFESSGARVHTKSGYDAALASSIDFYVKCNDSYTKTVVSQQFEIDIDPSPPFITSLSASPNPIIDQSNVYTTISVVTNELSICRFSIDNPEDFSDMPYTFAGFEVPEFKTTHSNRTGFSPTSASYDIFVKCRNRAGNVSPEESSFTVTVDISQSLAITRISTSPYTSVNYAVLNVTTNKAASCFYAESATPNIGMSSSAYNDHYHSVTGLAIGAHTYNIKCVKRRDDDTFEEALTAISVTYDNSNPEMVFVNLTGNLPDNPGYTYSTSKLDGEWLAQDNDTGITLYMYELYKSDFSGDTIILNGTTSSSEKSFSSLDLNDSTDYFLKVRARDSVGLWSEQLSSNDITVDTSLKPPNCANGIKDYNETDIDCGGDCDDCGENKTCDIDSDCSSGFCLNITSWYSRCKSPSCTDGVKNQDETDIDCGGSCPKCRDNKHCDVDDDCSSGDCDIASGKCKPEDKCQNGVWDQSTEAYIDCGGPCPDKCLEGDNCFTDNDCLQSLECKSNACTPRPADADSDGIIDSAPDNCINIPNPSQTDSDGDGIGDLCDPDNDNDSLSDNFEQQYFNCKTCANPGDDSDSDGLNNLREQTEGTNPQNPDTDGDGFNDQEELDAGTDPVDSSSYPRNFIFVYIGLGVIVPALIIGIIFLVLMLLKKRSKQKSFSRNSMPLQHPMQRPPIHGPQMQRMPQIKPVPQPVRQAQQVRPGVSPLRYVPKPSAKTSPAVQKQKEWLTLEDFKNVSVPKKQVSDVFSHLKGIGSKPAAQDKKDINKKIETITHTPASSDTFEKLREIARADKVSAPKVKSVVSHLASRGIAPKDNSAILHHMIESKKSTKTDVFNALSDLSKGKKMPEGHAEEILASLKRRLQ